MVAQVVVAPVVKWIFGSAIRGILGGGDHTPLERNRLFGPIARAIVNQPQQGTLGTVPVPAAPQPIPERPPPKVVSTPPLIPAPAPAPGIPGSPAIPRPPPSIPGIPSGPSIPDRLPPSVATGTVARSILQTFIRGGWASLLFYPREAGRGSALCVETRYGPVCPTVVQAVPAAVPLPSGPRRRSRRIPGTVAPPRRRDRGRVAQPAAPAVPRGRPITISRPVVLNPPRVVTGSMPPPRSLPPTVATFPVPGNVAAPAPIPAARALPVSVPAIAQYVIPFAAAWLGSQTRVGSRAIPGQSVGPVPGAPSIPGISIPSISIPGIGNPPQLGRVELPGVGPSPMPLPNLATAPLTSLSYAPAQSAAQDLDRQCRERAKRKRKKKREPRSVCYRGTFTETKSSTRKVRKEKIKCQ